MNNGELVRKPSEQLRTKEWVTAARLGFQQQIITFLLWAYGFLLLMTMALFFLQGFHLGGFVLDPSLLKMLGVATVGEIGGLLVITLRASFSSSFLQVGARYEMPGRQQAIFASGKTAQAPNWARSGLYVGSFFGRRKTDLLFQFRPLGMRRRGHVENPITR